MLDRIYNWCLFDTISAALVRFVQFDSARLSLSVSWLVGLCTVCFFSSYSSFLLEHHVPCVFQHNKVLSASKKSKHKSESFSQFNSGQQQCSRRCRRIEVLTRVSCGAKNFCTVSKNVSLNNAPSQKHQYCQEIGRCTSVQWFRHQGHTAHFCKRELSFTTSWSRHPVNKVVFPTLLLGAGGLEHWSFCFGHSWIRSIFAWIFIDFRVAVIRVVVWFEGLSCSLKHADSFLFVSKAFLFLPYRYPFPCLKNPWIMSKKRRIVV